jgi:hypothetical protein
MDIKDKIESLSKLIDALYKKLVILLAISDWVGYFFLIAFIFEVKSIYQETRKDCR